MCILSRYIKNVHVVITPCKLIQAFHDQTEQSTADASLRFYIVIRDRAMYLHMKQSYNDDMSVTNTSYCSGTKEMIIMRDKSFCPICLLSEEDDCHIPFLSPFSCSYLKAGLSTFI